MVIVTVQKMFTEIYGLGSRQVLIQVPMLINALVCDVFFPQFFIMK